jgi:hypothetical protein
LQKEEIPMLVLLLLHLLYQKRFTISAYLYEFLTDGLKLVIFVACILVAPTLLEAYLDYIDPL